MPHAKRETLATARKYLRAQKAQGGELKVDPKGGYRQQGIIRGVSVTTRGEALGHGFWLDQQFVDATTAEINKFNKGVKARFTHPGLSSDGLGTFLGRVMDAHTENGKTVADLHFSEAGHNTPDGDLATYVMDLAREDPEAFGLSIVFESDMGAEDRFVAENEDERGNFQSPDADNESNLPHARLASLRAADVVDEPAANPDGLFHREQQFAQEATSIASYALGITTERPQLVALGLDADRVAGFVTKFLNDHHLEITKMADESTTPVAEPAKPEAAAPVAATEPATQEQSAGKRFVEAFGKNGALWFVEGKTFEEAAALHAKAQDERITALEADKADLTNRLAGAKAAGEPEPVDFQSGEKNEKTRKGFASKIRMPADAKG